ncbi:hypothetical protein CLAC_07440 [Corynebacterium lactis RW2-5]|uniref:Uncharacterized protein n=1 Tax=Corynebacterium lactis RW2-5 TaxID=1408189 RepID=A0A0K2H3E6_9CORY|nr:hypothetical protein CLAC_07440 [Corynebacterium lactis RW2-5]
MSLSVLVIVISLSVAWILVFPIAAVNSMCAPLY